MPEVTVDGKRVHYKTNPGGALAKGPPLVLVHGAGGNLMHWPGELRRLPGRQVVAVDLPGHGKSGGQGSVTIGEYAESIAGLARAIALPSFVLAGHSMGGAIAQEVALRYPGLLAGLVLVGTGARLRVAPEVLRGIHENYAATAELLAVWTHGRGADANLMRLYVRRLKEVSPEVLYGDFLACDQFDRRADIARIPLPALIICGEMDRMTPLKFSETLRDEIPRSQLVVVPDAGHMVMLERPGEVAGAIAAFLQAAGSRGG